MCHLLATRMRALRSRTARSRSGRGAAPSAGAGAAAFGAPPIKAALGSGRRYYPGQEGTICSSGQRSQIGSNRSRATQESPAQAGFLVSWVGTEPAGLAEGGEVAGRRTAVIEDLVTSGGRVNRVLPGSARPRSRYRGGAVRDRPHRRLVAELRWGRIEAWRRTWACGL